MARRTAPAPTPTFPTPYGMRDDYNAMIEGLQAACISDNLVYLQTIEETFHRVHYDDYFLFDILTNGHIEFFQRYLMMSRMTPDPIL